MCTIGILAHHIGWGGRGGKYGGSPGGPKPYVGGFWVLGGGYIGLGTSIRCGHDGVGNGGMRLRSNDNPCGHDEPVDLVGLMGVGKGVG